MAEQYTKDKEQQWRQPQTYDSDDSELSQRKGSTDTDMEEKGLDTKRIMDVLMNMSKKMEQSHQELKQSHQELKQSHQEIKQKMEENTERIKNLEISQREAIEMVIARFDKKIEKQEKKIEENERGIADVNGRVAVMEKKCDDLDERCILVQQREKYLEQKVGEVEQKLEEIEKEKNYAGSTTQNIIQVPIPNEALPKFYGSTSINPMGFLKNVRTCFEAVHGDARKLQMVRSCLRDNALLWWDMISDEVATFAQFEERFISQFWGQTAQTRVRQELLFGNYRPGSDNRETYIMKRYSVLKYLNPPMLEIDMVTQLARHFNFEVTQAVAIQNISTMSQFFDLLRRLDDAERGSRFQRVNVQRPYQFALPPTSQNHVNNNYPSHSNMPHKSLNDNYKSKSTLPHNNNYKPYQRTSTELCGNDRTVNDRFRLSRIGNNSSPRENEPSMNNWRQQTSSNVSHSMNERDSEYYRSRGAIPKDTRVNCNIEKKIDRAEKPLESDKNQDF